MKEKVVILDTFFVPIGTAFRSRGKWWRKSSIGKAHASPNHSLFLCLNEKVAVLKSHLPKYLTEKRDFDEI